MLVCIVASVSIEAKKGSKEKNSKAKGSKEKNSKGKGSKEKNSKYSIEIPTSGNCEYVKDQKLSGRKIKKFKTDQLRQCCNRCFRMESCGGFSYDVRKKECTLVAPGGKFSKKKNTVSGRPNRPVTSVTRPTTEQPQCEEILECENNFVFDVKTCLCPCKDGFFGDYCEDYECNKRPTIDSQQGGICDSLSCNQPGVVNQCPFKCICQDACEELLQCDNGFVFDIDTCDCPCGPGFSGELCENFDCSGLEDYESSDLCNLLNCDDAGTRGLCPHKCFCDNTPF